MRKLGDLIMALGATIGVILAAMFLFRSSLPSMPWLIMVGMFKVGFASSLGVLAVGAFVRRLGRRAEERIRIAAGVPVEGGSAVFGDRPDPRRVIDGQGA